MAASAALLCEEIVQSGLPVAAVRAQCLNHDPVKLNAYHRPAAYGATMESSLPKSTRTFRVRFSDALRRRLVPNTTMTVAQLAGALGTSENTVKNLLGQANEPSARVIDGCISIFRDSFINEIYGCHNVYCLDPRDARKADALRRIAEAQDELRRLG